MIDDPQAIHPASQSIPGTSPSYRPGPAGESCHYLGDDPDEPCWGQVHEYERSDNSTDPDIWLCKGHYASDANEPEYEIEEHAWPDSPFAAIGNSPGSWRRLPGGRLSIGFGDSEWESWELRESSANGGQVEFRYEEDDGRAAMPLHLDRALAGVIGAMLVGFAATGRLEGPSND